jgi:formylglycine-generating enzyme required for sulfatase activity
MFTLQKLFKLLLPLFLLSATQLSAAAAPVSSETPPLCRKVFLSESEIINLDTFADAMTKGMLLLPEQSDLFEIYRKIYFGDPYYFISNKFDELAEFLDEYPEIEKPPFREYEISTILNSYEAPLALTKFVKSQIQTSAQIRSNLFQIQANLGYWKKLLAYEDPQLDPQLSKDQQKEQLHHNHARFVKYLEKMISVKNQNLLSELKSKDEDYKKKTKALFQTLKYIQEWMNQRGRNTEPLRQAMVDLIQNVGFGNSATRALLKSKNALDQIEGLHKILEERDLVAAELGYKNRFYELQKSLNIEFPSGFSKNEDLRNLIPDFEKEVKAGPKQTQIIDPIRVRTLSLHESPFRSCLGDNDCASRTYFEKALDPNYFYFTMTDSQLHSDGQVALVLGTAYDAELEKKVKIAFVDKIQNISNQKIPVILETLSQIVNEKGYRLALPESVGEHNGVSNFLITRHFIDQEILPKLRHFYSNFIPHSNNYTFKRGYTRVEENIKLKLYDLKINDKNTLIKPGQSYKAFKAHKNLNKEQLITELLLIKESRNPSDLSKYIAMAPLIPKLNRFGLYSSYSFQLDLIKFGRNEELPFKIRKQAITELLLLVFESEKSIYDLNKFNLTEAEKTQLLSEIKQWPKTSDLRKNQFMQGFADLVRKAVQNEDLEILKTHLENKLLDVNARDESEITLLHYAIAKNKQKVIHWLLQIPQLDLKQKDSLGFTDLEHARLLGQNQMADWILQERPEATARSFKVQERDSDGSPKMSFVKVPKGAFKMQTHNNKLSIKISHDFELFSTPTTQKTWAQILELHHQFTNTQVPENKNSIHKMITKTISHLTGFAKKVTQPEFLPLYPSSQIEPLNPVENISYEQVSEWLKILNSLSDNPHSEVQAKLKEIFPEHLQGLIYRLPTQAEWEFVARLRGLETGENSHDYSNFEIHQMAWYAENSQLKTQPVGLKKPFFLNGQPIYDFFGNVNVWCSDWYGDIQGGLDPAGPAISELGKVVKGNSYYSLMEDFYPGFLTNQIRFQNPEVGTAYVGFRIVRSPKKNEP